MKNLPASAGDPGSIPRSRRSPGEGHGKPLQYSSSKILWTEEAGGLHFIGSQRVRHDSSNLACTQQRGTERRKKKEGRKMVDGGSGLRWP